MFEIRAKIASVSLQNAEKTALIILETKDTKAIAKLYDEFYGHEPVVRISEFKHKRSKDANSYAWMLLDRLAAKLGLFKIDIYREYIKEIGGNCETVCVKNEAVERLCTGWSHNGIGWVTDTMPSKLEGCTNVILYYGSSTYDSEQMSRLINLIVTDCKEYGIQTMSDNELLKLKSLWGQS